MFQYQPVVRAKAGKYHGAALVGTHSVVIGWSFDDESLRDGLHGFAIKREEWDNATGDIIEVRWLGGYKRFLTLDGGQVGEVGSLTAPFQRFRWNDYTLNHKRSYRFSVFPMRGVPGALTRDEAPLIFEFSPTPEDDGDLGVYVNRGVTAAKAYFERFGDVAPDDVLPDRAAYNWLSRGLRESLVDFIESAVAGDSLHLAVYEFFDEDIAKKLRDAKLNGIDVQIVHDARKGKRSTDESRHIVHASGLDTLAGVVSERTTVNISHNKLAIHLRNGTPIKAWSGTANLSENGFNFQTNAAIVIRDARAVQNYEDYFQNLRGNPTKAKSKDFNIDLMTRANDGTASFGAKTFFSPIRKEEIIDTSVQLIEEAKSMVLISAPFGIHKDMNAALAANPRVIIEYGLANATAKSKIKHLQNRATRYYPPNKLMTYSDERWDAKAFGAHKIHTKIIVTDPLSDNPKVLFGSANFSKASCVNNDENALLIEGDKRLAAIMATEFMRMFDHYKSRFYIRRHEEVNRDIRKKNKRLESEGKPLLDERTLPIHLENTKKWSNTAFNKNSNSHKYADRLAFSGR